MGYERRVKLFRNGRNQAVRIPREFELPGEDAVMRKDGQRLVIEPVLTNPTLAELLDKWAKEPPLAPEEQWPEIDDPPPEPVDLFDD